jgi:hypothetical protein
MVEIENVHAETIHLSLAGGDEALAFAAQRLQILWWEDAIEDAESVFLEAAEMLGRNGT